MKEITIPKKLEPLVQAFYADSPTAAKALIVQAAQAIYGSDGKDGTFASVFEDSRTIKAEEIESTLCLMISLKPVDALESVLAAQIVVSHMLSMRKLASTNNDDLRIGAKLLGLSVAATQLLQRKRSGGAQHITVNYSYNGSPHTMQSVEREE